MLRRKWTVGAFDPNGRWVDTIGRKYWTWSGARRAKIRYELLGGVLVSNRHGELVPLTNYRVIEVSEVGRNIKA